MSVVSSGDAEPVPIRVRIDLHDDALDGDASAPLRRPTLFIRMKPAALSLDHSARDARGVTPLVFDATAGLYK
jgi:hypothetical protein